MHFTSAEWQVMNVLWAESPATVREVLNALEDDAGLSYASVKATMDGLADKEVLAVDRQGNAYRYTPIVSRDAVRRVVLRAFLDRAFDGTVGELGHLVADAQAVGADGREKLGERLAAAATEGAIKGDGDDA